MVINDFTVDRVNLIATAVPPVTPGFYSSTLVSSKSFFSTFVLGSWNMGLQVAGVKLDEIITGVYTPTQPEAAATTLPADVTDPPFPPVWPYFFSTDLLYGRDIESNKIQMVRGDDFVMNLAVILDGEPVDLTGCTLKMTAKYDPKDSDVNAVFQLTNGSGITITSATSGLATITIAANKTSTLPASKTILYVDIQLTQADTSVKTIYYGKLIIVPDVTVT